MTNICTSAGEWAPDQEAMEVSNPSATEADIDTDAAAEVLLTPSITAAFPQVFCRRLTYSGVIDSGISAVQGIF